MECLLLERAVTCGAAETTSAIGQKRSLERLLATLLVATNNHRNSNAGNATIIAVERRQAATAVHAEVRERRFPIAGINMIETGTVTYSNLLMR